MLHDELDRLEEGDTVTINDFVFEVEVTDHIATYAVNIEESEHEVCIDTRENEIKISEITP